MSFKSNKKEKESNTNTSNKNRFLGSFHKRLPMRQVGSLVRSIESRTVQIENEKASVFLCQPPSHHSTQDNNKDSSSSTSKSNTGDDAGRRMWIWRMSSCLCQSPTAAIPFAIMYAMLIYLYIVYMVTPSNDLKETSPSDFKFTFSCNDNDMDKNKPMSLTRNDTHKGVDQKKQKFAFVIQQIVGISVGVAIGVFIGISGLRSRYVRCVSVLILPGLLAGRGRTILMTVAMGLLLEGPINSINYNINQVVESQVCMYESVKQSSCYFNNQIEAILRKSNLMLKQQRDELQGELTRINDKIHNKIGVFQRDLIRQQKDLQNKISKFKREFAAIQRIVKGLNKPCGFVNSALADVTDFFNDIGGWFSKRKKRSSGACEASIPLPDIDFGSTSLDSTEDIDKLREWLKDFAADGIPIAPTLPNVKGLLKTSSVQHIRHKIMSLITNLFKAITKYMMTIKRCFLVLSMILLIAMAYNYLRQYLSDDAYDNHYIDDNIKRLWRLWPDTWPKMTPLRHWELEEKYQISASLRLSKIEWRRVLIKILPTLSFSVVVVATLLIDYGLTEFLLNLAVNGKFALTFTEVGGDPKSIRKVDLSTEPCLPRPKVTRKSNIAFLLLITLSVALTCLFDAYLSRLRSCICNQFYAEQGRERARYLYNQLKFGRNSRKIRIRSIVKREIKKREQLESLSMISRETLLRWKMTVMPKCCNTNGARPDECDEVTKTSLSSAKFSCPGCQWKVSRKETKSISIDNKNGTSIQVDICTDCAKDL